MHTRIPLFPLNTVLFPEGVLPLRIFEHRYLDMISDCMKNGCGIGVVLIKDGKEVGQAANTQDVGTLSEINYWHKRPDGLLGITLKGKQRFRILEREIQSNQLIIAEVELLPPVRTGKISDEYAPISALLERMIQQLDPPYSTMTLQLDDIEWVSARLTELLPLSLEVKQELLLKDEAEERLEALKKLLADKYL